MSAFFQTKIEFLKGVGPLRADMLHKELKVFTFGDLIQYYPYRYEDRSVFHKISEIHENLSYVQLKGHFIRFEEQGVGPKRRYVGYFTDGHGEIEVLWFKGINWVQRGVNRHVPYVLFGKPSLFQNAISVVHPELELYHTGQEKGGRFVPVYSTTEKLKKHGLDSKGLSKLISQLLEAAQGHIPETLPDMILENFELLPKPKALQYIHQPLQQSHVLAAQKRLSFEELFYTQLQLLQQFVHRKQTFVGLVFRHIPTVHVLYKQHLPFDLTEAQKKVIREIYEDMCSGRQMNRLLQGDVGSGKTIVAFISMLMAIDNGTQACLMAPTEILADQHYQGLKFFADLLGVHVHKITGSMKKSDKQRIYAELREGKIQILVGTHALIEDSVQFQRLGLCVIDEQHKFGVAQRARLWNRIEDILPHVLVMTATPIPRTLAMTFYGDLDVSIIDQMPQGRVPIKTVHRYESQRLAVMGFIREEIHKGRQIYIVYPLIEESQKMDLADLQRGLEQIEQFFPKPNYQISILHGRMLPKDKEFEMNRFKKGETQIMVATTVVEVGVNVPNATVMVIENAERFGLAQLHQLRGRVGRGSEQSYCILLTSNKLSHDTREKLATMVRTNNGFEIAEADLKIRGPGDIMGTMQSGVMDLLIADLARDQQLLMEARKVAQQILEEDPELSMQKHAVVKRHILSLRKDTVNWARIS